MSERKQLQVMRMYRGRDDWGTGKREESIVRNKSRLQNKYESIVVLLR